MRLGDAINIVCPQAEYSGLIDDNTKEQYDAVKWNDDRKKPTWEAVEKVMMEAELADAEVVRLEQVDARVEKYKLKTAREQALIDNDIEVAEHIERIIVELDTPVITEVSR